MANGDGAMNGSSILKSGRKENGCRDVVQEAKNKRRGGEMDRNGVTRGFFYSSPFVHAQNVECLYWYREASRMMGDAEQHHTACVLFPSTRTGMSTGQ